jgi:hypothetical protein
VTGTDWDYLTSPAWDLSGNGPSFTTTEQQVIERIWARVAEDFAPFNINVSTDYYGTFEDGQALRVAIGGNYNLTGQGNPERVGVIRGSSNLLTMLGARPVRQVVQRCIEAPLADLPPELWRSATGNAGETSTAPIAHDGRPDHADTTSSAVSSSSPTPS